MAHLCVVAYLVPVALLDSVMQWMPQETSGAVHWIVASGEVNEMQVFDTLWSMKEQVTMCILPAAGEASDEALFDIVAVEWPRGTSSVIVLCCEGQRPVGPLGGLTSLVIDPEPSFSAKSKLVAAGLARHLRTATGP